MKRFCLPLLFICMAAVLPSVSFAEDIIYYRMAHNDGAISFFSFNTPFVPTVVRDIALMILQKPFYPSLVKSEHYQLAITYGVLWQGVKTVQYDYTPLAADRFRHILWVTEDSDSVLNLEIYDNDNKLLYGAVYLSQQGRVSGKKPPPLKNSPEPQKYYFGFTHQYTEIMQDNVMRMFFSDGLNRFSLFRSSLPAKQQPTAMNKILTESKRKDASKGEHLIAYGNYIYSENINGFRYTVVGTIPFDKMGEIVKIVADEKTLKNKNAETDNLSDNMSDKNLDTP
ncbi:MAG: hypothetical protein LBH05_03840 [Deferribacteraceae bacterium]|jgi:hypothetical protein|nr:hypothetical protein [Deferribacteraceae bacterium]